MAEINSFKYIHSLYLSNFFDFCELSVLCIDIALQNGYNKRQSTRHKDRVPFFGVPGMAQF